MVYRVLAEKSTASLPRYILEWSTACVLTLTLTRTQTLTWQHQRQGGNGTRITYGTEVARTTIMRHRHQQQHLRCSNGISVFRLEQRHQCLSSLPTLCQKQCQKNASEKGKR